METGAAALNRPALSTPATARGGRGASAGAAAFLSILSAQPDATTKGNPVAAAIEGTARPRPPVAEAADPSPNAKRAAGEPATNGIDARIEGIAANDSGSIEITPGGDITGNAGIDRLAGTDPDAAAPRPANDRPPAMDVRATVLGGRGDDEFKRAGGADAMPAGAVAAPGESLPSVPAPPRPGTPVDAGAAELGRVLVPAEPATALVDMPAPDSLLRPEDAAPAYAAHILNAAVGTDSGAAAMVVPGARLGIAAASATDGPSRLEPEASEDNALASALEATIADARPAFAVPSRERMTAAGGSAGEGVPDGSGATTRAVRESSASTAWPVLAEPSANEPHGAPAAGATRSSETAPLPAPDLRLPDAGTTRRGVEDAVSRPTLSAATMAPTPEPISAGEVEGIVVRTIEAPATTSPVLPASLIMGTAAAPTAPETSVAPQTVPVEGRTLGILERGAVAIAATASAVLPTTATGPADGLARAEEARSTAGPDTAGAARAVPDDAPPAIPASGTGRESPAARAAGNAAGETGARHASVAAGEMAPAVPARDMRPAALVQPLSTALATAAASAALTGAAMVAAPDATVTEPRTARADGRRVTGPSTPAARRETADASTKAESETPPLKTATPFAVAEAAAKAAAGAGGGLPKALDTAPAPATTTLAAASPAPASGAATGPDGQTTEFSLPLAREAAAHAAAAPPMMVLRVHARDGARSIEIRLDPADLGEVNVKLETGKDGRLKAVLSADNRDSFDLLRRESGVLETALREAGVELGDDAITFTLNEQGPGQGDADRRALAYGDSAARRDAAAAEDTVAAAPVRWRSGILDISA